MLKLKPQYIGYLMGRTDSLEETLILGNIESRGEGLTEGEMAGWHHQLDGRKSEQALGLNVE